MTDHKVSNIHNIDIVRPCPSSHHHHNPAPLPTLSPSFQPRFQQKPSFKNFIQQDFHNNLQNHHSKTFNQDFKTTSQLNLSKTSFNQDFITTSQNHHSKTSSQPSFHNNLSTQSVQTIISKQSQQ